MEKIDVEAFEIDKGIYYIELQSGEYEINGERTNINWNDNKVIVDLDNKPEILKINSQSRIKQYTDGSGNILTPEEYFNTTRELTKNADPDDGDSDYYFADLDDEYAYKKFKQTWKLECETVEIKTPVNYDIKYNVYNLPKYITPMRKINGDLKSTIYVYDIAKHILELTRESLLDVGYIESKRESTIEGEFWLRPESIRFSKIDKCEFLTIKIDGLRQYEEKIQYKDTYGKVFDLYNKNIDNIKNIIETWYLSKKKLNISSYLDVIESLRTIEKNIISIESKSKTSGYKTSAINEVRNLIRDFEKYAKENKCTN